ncbi:MAG: alanine--tRNA ligase [Firmicutes bacterium]|nr:alanine--tRNA ligase [Bacillota bacterium]
MMKKIDSEQLRQLWTDFFSKRGHAVISSASLIPENDPTVLFTTAGMHPLVPYLLGQKHPQGKRLANVQKCVRTGDIDEVGDATHCTFFEMLGNWSLGDYFKGEMIGWSYEFLTGALGIPAENLAFSVFEGDKDAPRDDESAVLWAACGIRKDRIFYLPKKNNWWGPAGQTGPCGPDTEMFIDTGKPACSQSCSPACDCGKYIEIWNDVFMQYFKAADGTFSQLAQKNVDTGMGLERTLCILNGKQSVYETDLFASVIAKIEELSGKQYADAEYTKAFRIIADHIRTAVFIIGDARGVSPSNVDQGYVVRRLLRRALRYGRSVGLPPASLSKLADTVIEKYKTAYGELVQNRARILSEIDGEEEKFGRTLAAGLKEFEKLTSGLSANEIDGRSAFRLYDTFGFPLEMTVELAAEKGLRVDAEGFEAAFAAHRQLSQSGAEQRFKGGLADTGEETAKLHTATHLLQAALRNVLGLEVAQKGSNITAERLRFDFSFPRKMEEGEIREAEKLVNEAIVAAMPVTVSEMTVEEAKDAGAIGLFETRYGERVKVYAMGAFSKEICGGPHADNTGSLGTFKIVKEESSSAGVRRIKAVLE